MNCTPNPKQQEEGYSSDIEEIKKLIPLLTGDLENSKKRTERTS